MRRSLALVFSCLTAIGWGQMMPMGLTSKSSLLQIPEIQRELGMSKAKLAEVNSVRDQCVSEPDPTGLNDMQNPYRSVDAKLVPLLSKPQQKRLHELFLQENGLLCLSEAEVATQLKLKKEVLEDALEIIDRLMFQIMDHISDLKEGTRFDEGLVEDFKASAQRRLDTLLTNEERKRWKGLQGKPFRFPSMMRRRS